MRAAKIAKFSGFLSWDLTSCLTAKRIWETKFKQLISFNKKGLFLKIKLNTFVSKLKYTKSMKKKFFAAVALTIALSSYWVMKSLASESSASGYDLVSASVEALAAGEGTGNTGPREEVKCKDKYHKMVCKCMNEYDCTDSDCY